MILVKITFLTIIITEILLFVWEVFIKRIIDLIKFKKENKKFWDDLTRGDK